MKKLQIVQNQFALYVTTSTHGNFDDNKTKYKQFRNNLKRYFRIQLYSMHSLTKLKPIDREKSVYVTFGHYCLNFSLC